MYKYECYSWPLTPDIKTTLINYNTLTLPHTCYINNCTIQNPHFVTLQLQDSAPCYDSNINTVVDGTVGHCHDYTAIHWFITLTNDIGTFGDICSLVTHSRDEVVDIISNTDKKYIGVSCLVKLDV